MTVNGRLKGFLILFYIAIIFPIPAKNLIALRLQLNTITCMLGLVIEANIYCARSVASIRHLNMIKVSRDLSNYSTNANFNLSTFKDLEIIF